MLGPPGAIERERSREASKTVIDQELTRLAAGLAQGGDLKLLLEGIRAREQRRRALQEELAGLQGLRSVTPGDLQQLQRDVEARPILVLPPLAVALGHALALPPAAAEGMVLVAACSTAILSSLYTARARGTVALSVTVTAVSSVGSVATLPPILLLGLGRVAGGEARVSVPVGHRMGQLFVLLLVPAILGMIVRAAWPEPARRWAAPLRATGLAAVLAVVAAIVAGQVDPFLAVAGTVVFGAAAFAVVAMTAGWLTAAFVGGDPGDRFALAMAWSARNLGIATLVGMTMLGWAEWLVFTAAFFAAHAVLAAAAVACARVIAPARRGGPAA